MPRRRSAFWILVLLVWGCSGHVVRDANRGGKQFDFLDPPCHPEPLAAPVGAAEVDVRYLGAAGLYVHWGDDAILLGPFFSNPGLLRVLLGKWKPDKAAIERGLTGIPVGDVEAIFAGHSHYDHLGDFPALLERAPRARIFVNQSGVRALAPYPQARTTALEKGTRQWIWLTDDQGNPRPLRFLAVPSVHAPQIDHYLWKGGDIREDWREPWEAHRYGDLQAGQTFALVIDLMSSDRRRVLYRLYYQDSANPQGEGEPKPSDLGDDHPFDLAVLCIASYDKVPGQPQAILRALHPRHVLVTHYDDFMRRQDRPVRFIRLLTDGKVDHYLKAVCGELGCGGPAGGGPLNRVCGPSSPRWTMPLPGEWMRFAVGKS